MNKKATVVTTLLLFIVPVMTMYCCCVEASTGHNQAPNPKIEHCNGHHHESTENSSSHDSSSCPHAKVSGDISQQPSVLSSAEFKHPFESKLIPSSSPFRGETHNAVSFVSDTGPPGPVYYATPIYLQISVLLI